MNVIVYGKHVPLWNNSLSENSQLWKDLGISSIIFFEFEDDLFNYLKINILIKQYLIIPLLENHMLSLNKIIYKNHKEFFNYLNNIKILNENMYNVCLFRNKFFFDDYVKSTGPLKNFYPETLKDLKFINENKKYIIKPPCMNFGNGIEIFDGTKDYTEFLKNNYILQEYIENNEEYVSHIFSVNGFIKKIITYKYKFSEGFYIKKNNFTHIEKLSLSNEHKDVLELFLKPLKYTGICNIDFKIFNNVPYIFEINPRFGGSLFLENNYSDLLEISQEIIKYYNF